MLQHQLPAAGFGSPGAVLATTEEFNKSTSVITAEQHGQAGGLLNTARNHSSGLGATYDTAMVVLFWWRCISYFRSQQKNMMEALGQLKIQL